jgi:hypothetical protein
MASASPSFNLSSLPLMEPDMDAGMSPLTTVSVSIWTPDTHTHTHSLTTRHCVGVILTHTSALRISPSM